MLSSEELQQLNDRIVSCRACPRLVQWREEVARQKVRRYQDEEYWGRPLPGFGDPRPDIVVVGLAPAAHGGNRTGRMFTGDDSGSWLASALYHGGFANQPKSDHRDDGLVLTGVYMTAAVRCAPPQNRPTAEETRLCASFLEEELDLLGASILLCLGKFAFDAVCHYLRARSCSTRGWKFAHGAVYSVDRSSPVHVLCSYHPSRQNTQTGRLTREMFEEVFQRARSFLN